MSKCSLLAHVRTQDGRVVVSRLYSDLLHYTSNNRELTKEYYAVGTNEDFLNQVRDRAEFDENGEITFRSLKDLTHLEITQDDLLKALNKELGAGVMNYNEAVGKLSSFNRNSQYRDSYMATIVNTEDGKYRLSVVKKSKENQVALSKEISNRTLQDRIKYYLTRAGVSVDFLDTDEKFNGRYSTKNAVQTADGLYHLIQIVNGKKVSASLAEEAGHFAVGALGNSPLVTRLMNLLDEDTQRRILGDDYEGKYLGDSARREVAGTLVGQALNDGIDERAKWQSIMHRIVNTIKKAFATISGNDVMKASIEAKEIAEQIASGFVSDNFEGTTEEALKTTEELFSAPISTNVKAYRDVLNRLKLQAIQMKQISDSQFKKFNQIAGQVELGRDVNTPGALSDSIALEGIAEAVSLMSDLMTSEIPSLLDSVDFDNISDFYSSMPRNAKALRTVRTFVSNALAIIDIIDNAASTIGGAPGLVGDISRVQLLDSNGFLNTYDIRALKASLNNIIKGENGVYINLKNKESQFYLKFLENTLGKNYISRAARVIFNFKKGRKLLEFKDAEDIPISDMLKSLDSDISFFERWLASMSNSSDIIGQIADRVTKQAEKVADDITRNDFSRLNALQARFKALEKRGLFSDMRDLYEVGDDGKLTGYLKTRANWGDWEASFERMKSEAKENFRRLYPDVDSRPEFERGVLWNDFFKPLVKQWHKENSYLETDPQTGSKMWVPNTTSAHKTDYSSSAWKELHPDAKAFLTDLVNLKREIDERLPDGYVKANRAPQFKGTFTDKVRNRRIFEGDNRAFTHTVIGEIRDTFCESSDDTEYGCNLTYNSTEEQLFSDKLEFEKDKLNRVPLYGINKMKDTSELSTDIFHSMLAYSGMANSFAALSQIVDTLEVGKQVLNRRTVGGIKNEEDTSDNRSRAFNRYTAFLDKQVYGIGTKKIKVGNKLVLNKILGFMTGFASKLYLGGNVAGGIVNLGTGFIEVVKEAGAGENFTLKDWTKANEAYFKSLPHNLWDSGKQFKDDKVSLFINYFNVLGSNKDTWRGWNSRKSRIANFFGESLWFPYKTGEHYMQTIPYIALAHNIKLYDEYGEETTLWNAYKVEKDGTLSLKNSIYFKDPNSRQTYFMIQDILSKISNSQANTGNIFGSAIHLLPEEEAYLQSHNYNLANLDDTKTSLEIDAHELVWSADDETSFQNMGREICNRLHGIYNNMDKVAFQQNVYGNMVMAMRGYALGMMERRFGASKYSTILGDETGGSISDLAKVVASTFTDRGGFGLTARAILLPFSKKTREEMLNAGFSAHQYANMRRNFGDLAFIAMLALLKFLTVKPPKDDDDEEEESGSTAAGLCYYFASRLYREQAAYNSVRGALDESTSLLSLTPIGFSGIKDMASLAYGFIGQQFITPSSERLTGEDKPENYTDFYYNSKKEGAYTYGDSKAEKKLLRMLPYYRSTYVFKNPYDAAASFSYGRKVKN